MVRIGVDVGGTFTDVVAVDAATRELLASVKVPTTHGAPEGVALGIVTGIRKIMERATFAPEDVAFIAHSTTQATNALLEGDVARVAVLGLLNGTGPLARMQIRFPEFTLAPKVSFRPDFAFAGAHDRKTLESRVNALVASGAEAIAVSGAFSVDRPDDERKAAEYARSRGAFATAGHEVSSMYGLRARTRTAALNAAILPKMVRTAEMTAGAVHEAAVRAPLMIMRSDGGVMDVREMQRRPILTLLSGPAAGVAGALLHENVTDGIFIEVGGTSSDCSAIRSGMPQMRPARVGGHRTMLRTVDVRTLGIAGGSMPRLRAHDVEDVGPRSAHIAGVGYAAFSELEALHGARVQLFAPTPHDPDDYACLVTSGGERITVTPTCAANVLGYVPADACARGNAEAARAACALLGERIGVDAEGFAKRVLAIAGGITRIIERPELFSTLFAAITFILADSYLRTRQWRFLVALPLLCALWANVHAAVVVGLVLQIFFVRSMPQVVALGASVAGACLNPFGFRVLTVPFELTRIIDSGLLNNEEWRHPTLVKTPFYFVALALAAVLMIWRVRPRRSAVAAAEEVYSLLFGGAAPKSLSADALMALRKHPISGEPILYAPARAGRPNAFGREAGDVCPFCPGNESLTPAEISRSGDPWRVRVFPNKYPAAEGHEVIVDSNRHDASFESIDNAAEAVAMYVARYRAHSDAAYVSLFKNAGERAGASIEHIHSHRGGKLVPAGLAGSDHRGPATPGQVPGQRRGFLGIVKDQ